MSRSPKVALVQVPEAVATAVRAVVGAGNVVECATVAAATAVDVVVCEGREGAAPGPGAAILFVVPKGRSFDPAAAGDRTFDVLENPFDIVDLRFKLRALLDAAPRPLMPAAERTPAWLEPTLVGPAASATLAVAVRLRGAVWIVGEPGTGTDQVAAGLARAWDPREPVVWQESDPLASVLPRLGDEQRVLWVPSLEDRPLREQKAFERFLVLEPERRVVATSADAPEEAVAAGALLRTLHQTLSRVSLRLAPLRERRGEIPTLAAAAAARVALAAFGSGTVVLTEAARRALASWPWVGNLAELEAVMSRSVIARGGDGVVELDTAHLRFLPDHFEPFAMEDAPVAEAASPRRATVVAFDAARAGRNADATFDVATQATGIEEAVPQAEASVADPAAGVQGGVEGILAAFAHDIRNPMSTIKTFAGLQAARAGEDDAELARLAVDACQRVDEHLALLQRYAELAGEAPSRVDAVDVLGQAADALEAADGEAPLVIAARRALWTVADAGLLRLVADALAAESLSRRGSGEAAVADLSADGLALELRIATGAAAVDRLGKWVEGTSLPWRLALAGQAARRLGGSLDVDVEDGQMRLCWRLPADGEPDRKAVSGQGKGTNDDQAGSTDRRRRSRGS